MLCLSLMAAVLTSASEISEAAYARLCTNEEFIVTGRVTAVCGPILSQVTGANGCTVALEDGSGSTLIDVFTVVSPKPGDLLRVTGRTMGNQYGYVYARAESSSPLGVSTPPTPSRAALGDVLDGKLDCRNIRVVATVNDAFRDEIDPRYVFLILTDRGHFLNAAVIAPEEHDDRLESMIGARIAFTGICHPSNNGLRRQLGRIVKADAMDSIEILTPAASDRFDVPELTQDSDRLSPSGIASLGRRRIRARVLAVHSRRKLLLRCPNGSLHSAETVDTDLPDEDDVIEAVGHPESDSYRINLIRAHWRRVSGASSHGHRPPAESITAEALLNDSRGRPRVNAGFHGRRIRMEGRVSGVSVGNRTAILENGSHLVPLDLTGCGEMPEITGCRISVEGVCIMEPGVHRSYAAFPRIDGFILAVGSQEGITVLSRPSWWTPAHSMIVVILLVLAIVITLVWYRIHRAFRIARIRERTHLAAELHDSVTQTLSGVSLQLAASVSARKCGAAEADHLLAEAIQLLQKAITELRGYLWELRKEEI